MVDDDDDDDLPEFKRTPLDEVRMAHDIYLKAVNNPVRRRILEILSENPREKENLAGILIEEKLLKEIASLKYHLDYLLKARCIEIKKEVISITQEGKVVDYMEK
ncbi:MAG: ArsR family transcriptional regulator [Candidatus Hodarchaeota archaeon]